MVQDYEVRELLITLLYTSSLIRSVVLSNRACWSRLSTEFPYWLVHRAAKICHPQQNWRLIFRVGDRSNTTWNRMILLSQSAKSITLLSRPLTFSILNINSLSTIPHAPSPLTTLTLLGFRVRIDHLLRTLHDHPTLLNLSVVLAPIPPNYVWTCTINPLVQLSIGGHPRDLAALAENLVLPNLEHLILRPRGPPISIEFAPIPLYLQAVTRLTISGDLSCRDVNNYLRGNRRITHLELQLLHTHAAHSVLSDLALRDLDHTLPQGLVNLAVSPLDQPGSVQHLFERIKTVNHALESLTIGVDCHYDADRIIVAGRRGYPDMRFISTSVVLPKPLTNHDNIGYGGEGRIPSEGGDPWYGHIPVGDLVQNEQCRDSFIW